ncbi:MAG: hypothetical protein BroJett011_45940 [Chloroflexota bacterium]|nr:MAG: hypothetical protein BroJett011_45940 [Chloroflexota bacterium]
MKWLPWFRHRRALRISLWHNFRPPPWGGGNQFMLALKKALFQLGAEVEENSGSPSIDAHVLHAIWFDVEAFRRTIHDREKVVIHRLDGPVSLYRADGSGQELDDRCFQLNSEFASVTVFQSRWSLDHNLNLGYQPVNPVIIPNASDPSIFHPYDRIRFNPDRKVRLISVSWSDNPNKGFDVYKWLETHLDWDRFDYTFVGNIPGQFERIQHIPPQPSAELASLLRQHDIFITASRNDPCSNSLIEALTCGLPALYLHSGGHSELVQDGGLPFTSVEEILPQLTRLVDEHEHFQRAIRPPQLNEIAGQYLALLREPEKIMEQFR